MLDSTKEQSPRRAALSYEFYANGACWWDLERWERELDRLAAHGVTMPLILTGYEAVWYYAMLTLGVNREDAIGFLSGPAYYPLQLAGRLDSFLPMVDTDYLKKQIELGKRVLERARSLGMSPVTQGFFGHVPRSFKAYFPKAEVMPMRPWRNFPPTYRVSPTDPLFGKIGQALADKQAEFFGTSDHYICDPFSDVEPTVKKAAYFADLGKAISGLLSGAVWALSADSYSPELLSGVEKGKALVLDLDGTGCHATNGFGGADFITGTARGGSHATLHGDIRALADNPHMSAKSKFSNAVGAGTFPEGDSSPLYAELALDTLTADGKIDLDHWLADYANQRYASGEKCLADALKLLAETCYSPACTGAETGSVIAARPSTELMHTAPFDTLELRYDNDKLCDALGLLLAYEGACTDGYIFDVCDILRQIMSNRARTLYAQVMDGFARRDARLFESSTNKFLKLLEELDGLLNTHDDFRLETHLKCASSCAAGKLDAQNFEVDLLCQLTLFGPLRDPVNYDAGWREWGDLIGGYYLKRWHAFFEMLAKNFSKRGNFSTVTRKQIDGRNDRTGNKFYKALDARERNWVAHYVPTERTDESTVDAVKRLFEKYKISENL